MTNKKKWTMVTCFFFPYPANNATPTADPDIPAEAN